jgi:hypothetical protein
MAADSAYLWRPENRGPRPLAPPTPLARPPPKKSEALAPPPISGRHFPNVSAPIPGIFLADWTWRPNEPPKG